MKTIHYISPDSIEVPDSFNYKKYIINIEFDSSGRACEFHVSASFSSINLTSKKTQVYSGYNYLLLVNLDEDELTYLEILGVTLIQEARIGFIEAITATIITGYKYYGDFNANGPNS